MLSRYVWEALPCPDVLTPAPGQRTVAARVGVGVLQRSLRKRPLRGQNRAQTEGVGDSALQMLASEVGAALREALGRPMLYRDRSMRARGQWLLIARSGLTVLAAVTGRGLEVERLHWPLGQAAKVYQEPWREVARRLLFPHLRLMQGNLLSHPGGAEFLTLEAWGLKQDGRNLVWTGTFPPWTSVPDA